MQPLLYSGLVVTSKASEGAQYVSMSVSLSLTVSLSVLSSVAVSVSKTVTVPVSVSETVSGSVCQRDCHKPRPDETQAAQGLCCKRQRQHSAKAARD